MNDEKLEQLRVVLALIRESGATAASFSVGDTTITAEFLPRQPEMPVQEGSTEAPAVRFPGFIGRQ